MIERFDIIEEIGVARKFVTSRGTEYDARGVVFHLRKTAVRPLIIRNGATGEIVMRTDSRD